MRFFVILKLKCYKFGFLFMPCIKFPSQNFLAVSEITDLVSRKEGNFKEEIRSIFQRSVSDESQVTNEFVNNWIAAVKKQLGPVDIKALEIVCHELAIAFNLSEKYKMEERIATAFLRSKSWNELCLTLGLSKKPYSNCVLRAELAKIAAVENARELSRDIRTYWIKDQATLVEIAKIAAAKDGEEVSKYIQRYKIKDQTALVEIAKIAAAQNAGSLSEHIQNYTIRDPTALVEIAKIAAAQPGLAISNNIQKYGIKDPDALIEIAKIGAAQNGWVLSSHIQEYEIKDLDALIEIAKIAAAQNGEGVSVYIEKYGIKDGIAIAQIAKIAAAQNGWGLSKYIQNYKIKDPDALIKIAKIAAAQNGEGVSLYIEKYGIKDGAALVEIAKVAAAESGWGVSFYIDKYEIRDQVALVEIAKIAAEQNGWKVSTYIKNYGIRDQIELLGIFFIGARDQQLIDCQNFLIEKPETEDLYPSLLLFQNRALDDLEIERFIRSIECSAFKEIAKELTKEKNLLVRDETLRCLALVYLGCQLKEVPLVNQAEGEELIKGLLALRNPVMRRAMVSDVVDALKEETSLKKWKDLRAQSTANSKHALPLMLLTSLVERKHYQKIGATLKHRDFKEIRRINGLLECLAMLTKNKSLSLEQKEFIVTRLLFGGENPLPKMVYQRALMVLQSLSFGKEQEIKELEDPSLLVGILEREFIERFGLSHTDDFFAIFLKFQESFRTKDSIVTYAAAIESLPPYEKQLCKPILQSYVQGILDGSFKDRRYEKKNNPHLQEVFKDPTLEELWKKGAEYSLGAFLKEDKSSFKEDKSIDFRAFFIEKIITDSHFPKDSIPYVAEFLENPISLEEALQKVKEAIKSSGNFDEVATFGLQEKMLQLMEPEISSEEIIRILQNLISRLSRSNPEVELINDLEGKLAILKALGIKRPQQLYDDWNVVDTDDPALLLVLGSEVSGSCQRVEGNPNLNKCLLDYLMDGKNRAVAVVNAKEEVQARCILRLLWDEKNSCPILFQERIYFQAQCPTQIAEVLNQVCLKRAKELNLTLLSETPSGKLYPNSVYSLGSVAPFEYVDAKGTGVTQGKWSLQKVFVQK